MPAAITAMALVVVVCMVVAMNAKHQLPDSLSALLRDARVWGAVAAAVLLSCWTDYFLFYWAAANRIKMWLILLIGWGVMKILPVLVDGVLLEVSAQLYEHPWEWYGALTAVSPLGTIILTKGDASWSIVLGLASQLGFVLFMGSVCIRTQRRLVDRVTTYTAQADPTALASIAFADVENPASPPSE
jgi:hypothetical protein